MSINFSQETCSAFLRCPLCCRDGSLRIVEETPALRCTNCQYEYPAAHGIPALMAHEEIHALSRRFLGLKETPPEDTPSVPLVQGVFHPWTILGYAIMSEFLYLLVGLSLLVKKPKLFLKKLFNWTRGSNFSDPVKRGLFYNWNNYFNLLLKAGEVTAFSRMSPYIAEPSLEIGCGACETTNMIFLDTKKMTFGCEYFMDTYLTSPGEMYNVIRHHVGGSIRSLPFSSRVFQSVVMVHIIDHITSVDAWFEEIHRVIKPGGHLIMDTYSNRVFDLLPGVRWRAVVSKEWAEKYKRWRTTKLNPRRGGIPLKSDNQFYATAQNMFSEDEWSVIAKKHGFTLVDHYFFTDKMFAFFMDLEYRGFFPSILSSLLIYLAIDEKTVREENQGLPEEDAGNVILVFRKDTTT